jgi:2-desacetyl-2-hydroxyethyl bacteriochlorophyllide A dehydrogenase
MKTAYYIGDRKFEIVDREKITPAKGEVRLKVAFCGVCGTDLHIFHGVMDKRVSPPQVIGHEASCIVDEIGEGVTNVKVGDKVTVRPLYFGESHPFDRGTNYVGKNLKFIGIDRLGAFQQSWVVPAYTLHKLPDSLSLKYGALIEPLAVACHDTKVGRVKAGEHCVVLGGGPIGILIAFVLREKGANVMISEINQTRLDLIKSFGFQSINPSTENLPQRVSELTSEAMADAVFEVSGSDAAAEVMTDLVCVHGRIIMVAVHGIPKKVNLHRFFWSEIEMIGARLYEPDDYDEAIRIASTGRIPFEKLITSVKPLESIQELFEEIDLNREGMKCLIDCTL